MSDRYCETCYYEDFDPFAYPCAMCIRGYERTDKWKPKNDEPQREHRDCINCESADDCAKCRGFTDEPQTEREGE